MLPPCPELPGWAIDWARLDEFPWLRDMRGCPQNPDRHAEGDVWNHVHMVVEAMVALPAWRALPETDRRILFWAALLHDVAKPACTKLEPDGRYSARGHAWRGAVRARSILWRLGLPFAEREQVCAIVRHHLVPFFFVDSADSHRLLVEVSQTARCDLLTLMAETDVRGRICPDPQRLFDRIAAFGETARQAGCWDRPFTFPSESERFQFFRQLPARSVAVPTSADLPVVILLSGLPGAGKDHWLERNSPPGSWPCLNLEELRLRMRVPPSDPKGLLRTRAREIAIDYLQAGQSFVWNAYNLSRGARTECIRLLHEYPVQTRIVYVEVPPDRLFRQNEQRLRRVPERVIERMLDRWEVPDLTEAHAVDYVLPD